VADPELANQRGREGADVGAVLSAREHTELLCCRTFILDALRPVMADRSDPQWVERERAATAIAANQWAEAHGLVIRLTVYDIERIEVLAVGHVDYATKLALYVAEAVYGREVKS
jgi:hypothetical protein